MKSISSLQFPRGPRRRNAGVALVIVLAFIVIITGVILAFFSQSLFTRQISDASANQTKADLVAQGAADTVLADIQQEIVMGSSLTTGTYSYTNQSGTVVTGTYYVPLSPVNMVPQISGTTTAAREVPPNLVKRSAYDYSRNHAAPFYIATTGSIPGAAAIAVSSTTPSLNGRTVSVARWNSHYLLPLTGTSLDSTPITPGSPQDTGTLAGQGFTPPDWVLVTRGGSNPTAWSTSLANPAVSNTNYVTSRYAYAVYNEGGLLDVNVAGYPFAYNGDSSGDKATVTTGTVDLYAPSKPALSYADLTQIGLSQHQVNQLVAWRNYASAQVSSGTGFSTSSLAFSNTNGAYSYHNFVTGNPTGFMRVSGAALNNNGTMSITQGQSDRMFSSRQELIGFLKNGLGLTGSSSESTDGASMAVAQYLTTFSRGLNQPSFTPSPSRPLATSTNNGGSGNDAFGLDNEVNPGFLSVRVSGTGFIRNDGSVAVPGEPLVKKRFALNRLAWLTYLGPSANRVIPAPGTSGTGTYNPVGTPNPGAGTPNYDMWAMVNLYGIPLSVLQQGTPQNIQKYFGLTWQVDAVPAGRNTVSGFHDGTYKWYYNVHCEQGQLSSGQSSAGSVSISNTDGTISRIEDIALVTGSNAREPDFFELLKATIAPGSIAKGFINLTGSGAAAAGITPATNALHPYCVENIRDTTTNFAILQLGANIATQFAVDGYPRRIVFDDGTLGGLNGYHEFRGVGNLPYLYRFQTGTLKVRNESPINPQIEPAAYNPGVANNSSSEYVLSATSVQLQDKGVVMLLHIPVIWNPHDIDAPIGSPAPTQFRVVADSVDPDFIDGSGNNSGYNAFGATGIDPDGANQTADTGGNGYPGPGGVPTGINDPYFSPTPTSLTAGPGTPLSTKEDPVVPQPLGPKTTAMTFQVPATSVGAAFFREPTMLAQPNVPAGSNLALAWSSTYADLTILKSGTGNVMQRGGFMSTEPNPLNLPVDTGGPYIGMYIGLYPALWIGQRWSYAPNGTLSVRESARGGVVESNGAPFITYRLQYLDPNPADGSSTPHWITYDEKYTQVWDLFLSTPMGTQATNGLNNVRGSLVQYGQLLQSGSWSGLQQVGNPDWQSYIDPRTARFGAMLGPNFGGPPVGPGATGTSEWVSGALDEIQTDRPGVNAGYSVTTNRTNGNNNFLSFAAGGWTIDPGATSYMPRGLFSQNSSIKNDGIRFPNDLSTGYISTNGGGMHYADADGIVRGAMGNYVLGSGQASATTANGLPMATAYPNGVGTGTVQGQSRPYFLHRPFRSVAELGYVFSGTPWKNLDFFTPQSGNAALLDAFCISDAPDLPTNSNELVAGTVNLNTRQPLVLQAILAGAYAGDSSNDQQVHPFTAQEAAMLSATEAATSGTTLIQRTMNTTTPGQGPLENLADLVGRQDPNTSGSTATFEGPAGDVGALYGGLSYSGTAATQLMQNVQRFRESFIRPLAAVGNTRVWNLLIDVVAQTGRYPQGASSPANFVVEGEQRYWVHVAIDRLTGQVLDKQVEVVKD